MSIEFIDAMLRVPLPVPNIDTLSPLKELRLPDPLDVIVSTHPLIRAFQEVDEILRKSGTDARIVLDLDPDYGLYILVETRLRASQALELWRSLVDISSREGVWIAVTWVENDVPKHELIESLAEILARSSIKLRFAEGIDITKLVRETRE